MLMKEKRCLEGGENLEFTLKCCGKTDPIGVSDENLRLSFETNGKEEILSYEVNIATSIEQMKQQRYNIGTFYGEIDAAYVVNPDKAFFKDKTRYYWQVKVETREGSCVSDIATFETGLSSWSADWIGGPQSDGTVLLFQKPFQIKGNVTYARLYICGLGYFGASLDGEPLDDTYYKPLVTDYGTRYHPENTTLYEASGHRVTYYTYDVTRELGIGNHELSIDVGNGYYCNVDRIMEEPNFSFGQPRLIFELHITEDGRKRIIKSGTDTLVRLTNCRSTLYEGDFIDFTEDVAEYQKSTLISAPGGKLVSPLCEDDKVKQVLKPVSERKIEEGILYDFGVNHTGGLKITVEAEEGEELFIRYAEILDAAGQPNYETSAWHDKNIYTGQMRDAYQENRYILKKGVNEITPMFNWYCYRYVVIKKANTVQIKNLESLFICTDVERNGHFACSEETLNRLNDMFLQTLLCNMHSGMVMDCPHREKRPYTGDGHLTMKASYYNLDTISFYYKWFEDLLDAQTPEGLIPNSAPNLGGGGGYAWGNAICFVTKYLYQFTGDKKLAKRGYEAILKWLTYYESKRDKDYIIRSNSHSWMLGDWLAPEAVSSNVYYINTMCYLMAVDSAIFMAEKFDTDRITELQTLRGCIADGINRIFFHEGTLSYGNGVQGEDVFALALEIVPDTYKQALKEKIEQHYRVETDYHLDTGIVLTPILIEHLTDKGYRDIAYGIMTAKTYPSYYSLMENDTTFSEHWSKKWPDYYIGDNNSKLVKGGGDLSHCHPMYGSVCAWLYERVAGLDLTELHRKKVGIHPYFTDCLTWAKADKIVPYGKISVEWENKEEGLILKVVIPKGLVGEVCFPSQYSSIQNQETGEKYEVQEDGYFRFQLPGGTWMLQTQVKRKEKTNDD